MKGKIDENGWLRIERGGKERLQECPFMQRAFQVNDITIAPCGDWCPYFGEPRDESGEDILLNALLEAFKMSPISSTRIELCHKTLIFDQFIDERK